MTAHIANRFFASKHRASSGDHSGPLAGDRCHLGKELGIAEQPGVVPFPLKDERVVDMPDGRTCHVETIRPDHPELRSEVTVVIVLG